MSDYGIVKFSNNFPTLICVFDSGLTQIKHIVGGLFREVGYDSQYIVDLCNRSQSPVVPVAAFADGPDHESTSVSQRVKYSKKLLFVFVPIPVV